MAGTGTKTNERPGTRSQVRYARMSASKARVVLDLIRGKHVAEASHILAFSERRAAAVIDKCLRAAVANAGHNDDIPEEELYVSACYADQGPTLKRFRPRARGRAGRIHRQTCHITIIVSRYEDTELDELRRRAEQRGAGGSRTADARADRRRRVARSRAAAEPEAEPVDTEDETADETAGEAAPVEETTGEAAKMKTTEKAAKKAKADAEAEPEDTVDEPEADPAGSDTEAEGSAPADDADEAGTPEETD
jgi:large subunit ribosomal protein L22